MMMRHLRVCAWVFAILVSIPFALGVLASWPPFMFMVAMILITVWPVAAFLLAVGLGVPIALGIKAARRAGSFGRGVVTALMAPVAITAAVLLAIPSAYAGGMVGDATRLLANQRRYEAAGALTTPPPYRPWRGT